MKLSERERERERERNEILGLREERISGHLPFRLVLPNFLSLITDLLAGATFNQVVWGFFGSLPLFLTFPFS